MTARIAVAVPRRSGPMMIELAGMLIDSLTSLGDRVDKVGDGDRALLDADLIVMFGDVRRLSGSIERLKQPSAHRPPIVLWQIDSLPPPDRAEQSVNVARREQRLHESVGAPLVRALTSRRLRSRVLKLLRPRARSEPLAKGWGERLRLIEEGWSLGWLDHVAVSMPERTPVLRDLGVDAAVVPVGYHPWMGHDANRARDLDAVFLGYDLGDSTRRGRLVEATRAHLADRGIALTIRHGDCFGAERVRFLNRARIGLNLHQTQRPAEFSRLRVILTMACGALVVSEPAPDMTPFRPGEHLAVSTADEIPEVVEYYLAHEDQRRALAEAGRRFATSQMTMRHAAASLRLLGGLSPSDRSAQSSSDA